jgi:GH25 family lysozyme M1 (1,4-beta-N-acetylmuramidase)
VPYLDGIDVSDAKGVINWQQVASTSPALSFVMSRMTHGGHGDNDLRVDKQASANKAGMRRWFPTAARGFYHFLGTSAPAVQAAHFARVTGPLLPGEFVMLDVEQDAPAKVPILPVTHIVDVLEAIEREMGATPFLYIGGYYPGSVDRRLWRFPLILPAYTTEAKYLGLAALMGRPVLVWQWGGGAEGAVVAGIPGRTDSNRIENRAAFHAALVRPPAPPKPVPPPQPPEPMEDDDMVVLFTHSDEDHEGHPPRWTFWALRDDGSKRHVTEAELAVRGVRDTVPAIPMVLVDSIPDELTPGG